MKTFSLSVVRDKIKNMYERHDYADSADDFPWDRGYRTGYADALEHVLELLSRIKED